MTLYRLSSAWCLAMLGAAIGLAPLWVFVAAGGAAFAAGCFFGGRRQDAILVAACALAAIAALLNYQLRQPSASDSGVSAFNDAGAVELRGMVASQPETRETTQRIHLRVDAYRDEGGEWQETAGTVLVTLRPFPEYEYGDYVELSGEIEKPRTIDGFDYREFLAQQGIGSVSYFPSVRRVGSGGGSDLMRALMGLRGHLRHGIEVSMPEPEASLAVGMLLGDRAAIPDDVNDDFKTSGIAHLIAISGANMMLVAAFVTGGLWRYIGRRRALVAAIVVVVAYALLVGGSGSVLRATAVVVVVLGSQLSGRPGGGLPALVLAVATLTLIWPRLADDVSFQLSVAATAGIVLWVTPLTEAAVSRWPALRNGAQAFLLEQVAITVAASVAVLPVMGRTFGTLSLVLVPANVAATLAFEAVIPLTALTSVVGWLSADAGRLVGEVASLPLTYLVLLADAASRVPFASIQVGFLLSLLLTGVAIGVGRSFVRSEVPVPDEEPAKTLRVSFALQASVLMVLFASVLFARTLTTTNDRLEVTVLDIGQGDAILIETPDGHVALIDGGPSVSRLLNELGAALPRSEHRIDLVVLSHPQEDHITGLVGLFDRYDVGAVLAGPREGTIGAYDALRERIAAAGVPMITAERGMTVGLGRGAALEVLGPPPKQVHGGADELNENSVVLRLSYGDVRFLLTGDLGFLGEEALLRSGADLHSTVLKVGHHGSDGSTSTAFLEAVQPEVAAISVGAENSFGHPSPTTRLRLAEVSVLRTDLNGRITFATDGRSLRYEPERGGVEVIPLGVAEK